MKIAEALSKIKSLKGKLSRDFALAAENLYFVEGETPEFKSAEHLKAWDEAQIELRNLVLVLQRANHRVKVASGKTLAEAILELADLRSRAAQYERLIRSKPENKYLRDERVIYTSAVPVTRLVEELETMTAAVRRIDIEIQETNWLHELEER